MAIYIIPNELRDQINARLDEALKDFPECLDEDREILYHQLLEYFNEHGIIPDFKLEKKDE